MEEAVIRVELPPSIAKEAPAYHLHPVLGDAFLQAVAGVVPLEEDGSFSPYTYMPVGVRRVQLLKKINDFSQPLFIYARRTSSDSRPSPERVEADIFLVTEAGEPLAVMEGAQVQRLGRNDAASSSTDTSRWLYEIAWREEPLNAVSDAADQTTAAKASSEQWLIFADAKGVGCKLADKLTADGQSCVLVEAGTHYDAPSITATNGHPRRQASVKIDPLDEGHYRRLLDEVVGASKLPLAGVVHLWSLDIPADSAAESSSNSTPLGCAGALQLARALSRTTFAKQPTLWFVTAGAQAGDGLQSAGRIAVEQSPMIGFGRVAALELPDFRPRLFDLDAAHRQPV